MKRQRHKVGEQHEWGSHAGTAARHWSLSFGSSQGLGARPTGTVEITGPAPSNVGPSNRTSNLEQNQNIDFFSIMDGPPCFAIF